jgi:hypothetical protein
MIKILTLAPYKFLPAENGGQKAIERLYTSLSKYTELTCVSTTNNDLTKDHGFELLPLFSNSKLRYADIFSVFSLTKFIKKRGITHLLIEHPYMGWMALQIKKRTGVKLIVHSHNIEGERFKSMNKWWSKYLADYEKYIHQKADLSLFITKEDQQYAVKNFSLDISKTIVTPFSVELNNAPSFDKKNNAKEALCQRYSISPDKKLLVFAGAFNYAPNLDGLKNLLTKILPELDKLKYNYHLIVCGKDIPAEILHNKNNSITYTGFVKNIHEYYCGGDVFVNPIVSGGGIKTKLVEALGNNCDSVSTVTGAIGIASEIIGQKLQIVQDNNWKAFAEAVINSNHSLTTPRQFYDYFNADKIGDRIVSKLQKL